LSDPVLHVFAKVEVTTEVGKCPQCREEIDGDEAILGPAGVRKMICPHCESVLWTYRVVLTARGE